MGRRDDHFWDDVALGTFENEAAVEVRLIIPLLRALGYEAEDIYPKYPVEFQQGRRGRKPEADFVVFAEEPYSRATSLITVEAKSPSEELGDGKSQGESYAANIRTPILIITNGVRLEVWQIQVSTESELALRCAISELPSRRGEIEALLTKEAVKTYSRTLLHKSFGLLARDLGAYERAEFERATNSRYLIARRLREVVPRSADRSSIELLQAFPDGALIVGASGYGKTSLAGALRRQAVELRWSNDSAKLPIEVFLPDTLEHRKGLEAFLRARVAAHCPQVTTHAFRTRLRDEGITLLCDGFDRILPDQRASVEGKLINFRRDYPKTQLFVMTRPFALPERLMLRTFELQELDDEEQREIVEHFCRAENLSRPLLWRELSNFLKEVCRHPVILDLVLTSYKAQGQVPIGVEPLFKAWLDRVIPNAIPIGRRTDLKRLLTILANETVLHPIGEDEAVALVRGQGFPDNLLQDLLETDAISQTEQTIELRHEALADYLRALDVVRRPLSEVAARLELLPLRSGSQLPALLMATARSAEMQQLIWSRIVATDITAAISALQYRADISSRLATSDSLQISHSYLSDILEGIDLSVDLHFPRLASRIRFELIGKDTDRLGIVGSISDQSHLAYSFVATAPDSNRVSIGDLPKGFQSFGKNLRMMGLRIDSGRLVGMGHVRETLLDLIKHRRLDGGLIWAEERAMSRIRHLVHDYEFPCGPDTSLLEIRMLLLPHTGSWVRPESFRSGQTFEIDELLGDVNLLIEHGRTHLKSWWDGADSLDLRSPEGRVRLTQLLNAHHHRTQLAYREVAEASFPLVAIRFPFYQIMPLQYQIEVELHNRRGYESETLHWTWIPVSTFEDAGATVTFPANPADLYSDNAADRYYRRIDEALARYGRRAPDCRYMSGQRGIPDFFGRETGLGNQINETSVLRSAAELIEEDLNWLFRELRSSDHGLYD